MNEEKVRAGPDDVRLERVALNQNKQEMVERAHALYNRAQLAYEQAQSAMTLKASEMAELRRGREQLALVTERERIAREVQSGTIRGLFSVGMHLQAIMSRNPDAQLSAELQSCVDDLDDAITELRNSMFAIEPIADAPDAQG